MGDLDEVLDSARDGGHLAVHVEDLTERGEDLGGVAKNVDTNYSDGHPGHPHLIVMVMVMVMAMVTIRMKLRMMIMNEYEEPNNNGNQEQDLSR